MPVYAGRSVSVDCRFKRQMHGGVAAYRHRKEGTALWIIYHIISQLI